jgi:hypothetical protein
VYNDRRPSDNTLVALDTPSWSNSTVSLPSSGFTAVPWNVLPEGRESKWDDEITMTTAATEFSPQGSNPSSEEAASVNEPLIEENGARRPGSASPLYDDHVAAALLHFQGPRHHIPTEFAIDTLIDALLEIGDYEEEDSDSVASLGMSSLFTYYIEEGSLEKAFDDKSTVCGGVGEDEDEDENTQTAWEDTQAAWEGRRAWEDMKRRVMYIEEFGAAQQQQPLDGAPGDAERASREFRARRRRNWAEEAIRGSAARDEVKRRASAKRRRRHAGYWVRQDGVLVRLVSDPFLILPLHFCIHSWTHSRRAFTIQYARRT